MGFNNATNNLFREQKVVNSAVTYVVLDDDVIINITDTTAPRTVTLPAPSATNTGKFFVVKDTSGGASSNNITVAGASGNIDGAANYTIDANYGSAVFYSDGSNYFTQSLGIIPVVSPAAPTRSSLGVSFNSSTHNTWVDSGFNIVVPAGTQRLTYNCKGNITNNGAGMMIMECRLFDVTEGSAVTNSARNLVTACNASGFSGTSGGSAQFDMRTSNVGDRTYRIDIRKTSQGGTPNTGQNMTLVAGSYLEYRSDEYLRENNVQRSHCWSYRICRLNCRWGWDNHRVHCCQYRLDSIDSYRKFKRGVKNASC